MTEEIDMRLLLKLIINKKKVIIGGILVCAVLAGGLSFLVAPSYQSSLILEVGRIYLSPRMGTRETQFMEEPEAVANLLSSIGILSQVNRELDLGLIPKKIQKHLEVNTFLEAEKFLPILEVIYEGRSPREAVDVLNALAGIIVVRHDERYRPYQTGLERKIQANREKISAVEQIITAQTGWRDLSQQYIEKGEVSTDEFIQELGNLN